MIANKAVSALAWARLITTDFRTVATAYQLAAAKEILSPAGQLEYAAAFIDPVGPTLHVLRDLLAEETAGRLAELEGEEGPAEDWPLVWDCISAELVG